MDLVMRIYDDFFSVLQQPIAQVLLTRGDLADRDRYINAHNTFRELLKLGVIPVVNENDTVDVFPGWNLVGPRGGPITRCR